MSNFMDVAWIGLIVGAILAAEKLVKWIAAQTENKLDDKIVDTVYDLLDQLEDEDE